MSVLSPAEYGRANAQSVVFATAEEIGGITGTSDATVIPFAEVRGCVCPGVHLHALREFERMTFSAPTTSVEVGAAIRAIGESAS